MLIDTEYTSGICGKRTVLLIALFSRVIPCNANHEETKHSSYRLVYILLSCS